MRRKRKQDHFSTPISETIAAPAADQEADSEEDAPTPTEKTGVHSASEAEPTANHRKRKRRRRKKSSAASKTETVSATRTRVEPADAVQRSDSNPPAASRPKVVWPDPKPSDRTGTADNRLAYTPELYTPEFVTQNVSKPLSRQDQGTESAAIEKVPARASEAVTVKVCLYCGETKPLGDFLRRTGSKSGHESRRGACRDCRKRRRAARLADGEIASDPLPLPLAAGPARSLDLEEDAVETLPKRRFRRPPPEPPEDALLEPTREAELRTTKQGTVRMRGRTDKGRRWQQETDLEMARCLVREHAAVVVNRFTIRRLYTNRSFRRYILERDRYTCHFCGEYGDTIDHLLPRAKGGHTTPLNCVCACMLCNQNKADRDLDEFMEDAEPLDDPSSDRGFERRPIEH